MRIETHSKAILINSLEIRKNSAEKQLTNLQQQILAIGKKDKAMSEQYTQLMTKLPYWQQSNSSEFAYLLHTFANTIPTDTWLTYIKLNKSGHDVNLFGHALSTQSTMQFVSQLNLSSSFRNNHFKVSKINHVSDKTFLYFHLTNINDNEE